MNRSVSIAEFLHTIRNWCRSESSKCGTCSVHAPRLRFCRCAGWMGTMNTMRSCTRAEGVLHQGAHSCIRANARRPFMFIQPHSFKRISFRSKYGNKENKKAVWSLEKLSRSSTADRPLTYDTLCRTIKFSSEPANHLRVSSQSSTQQHTAPHPDLYACPAFCRKNTHYILNADSWERAQFQFGKNDRNSID